MFSIQSPHFLIAILLLVLLYLVVGACWNIRRFNLGQYFIVITFIIYLLCVIQLVFFPIDVNIGKYANLTPWYKTINFIPILTIDVKTFLLNILMLIPFGMYLPLLNRQFESLKGVAYHGLFLSLFIEIFQLMNRVVFGNGRSTDINDLIANTVGAILGYMVIKALIKRNDRNNLLNKLRL